MLFQESDEKLIRALNDDLTAEVRMRLVATEDPRTPQFRAFCETFQQLAPKVHFLTEKVSHFSAAGHRDSQQLAVPRHPAGKRIETFPGRDPHARPRRTAGCRTRVRSQAACLRSSGGRGGGGIPALSRWARAHKEPPAGSAPSRRPAHLRHSAMPLLSGSAGRAFASPAHQFAHRSHGDRRRPFSGTGGGGARAGGPHGDSGWRFSLDRPIASGGAVSEALMHRDPARLDAAALERMIKDGHAAQLARMMLRENRLFPAFLKLLVHPEWSVRMGAMVVLEEIAEGNRGLAGERSGVPVAGSGECGPCGKGRYCLSAGRSGRCRNGARVEGTSRRFGR